MDEYYDSTQAANAVERIAKERQNNPHAGPQLAGIVNENGETVLQVINQNKPAMWRLMYNENGAQPVEAVLSIQGILWQKDLPPFYEKQMFTPKRAHYLKQSVALTGLGAATFQNAVNSAVYIFGLFSRYVPQNKLQKWCPGEYRNTISFDMANRLFTPRKDDPMSPHIPFGKEMDPDGKLAGLMGGELFHGEDNQVRYMGKTTGKEGEIRYIPIEPVTFQTGDIVEAKITFIVIPVRGGEFKMLTVLRGLTLVDASHSHRAFLSRMGQPITPKVAVLKRKVGYEEEEDADTRARLDKLRVDTERAMEEMRARQDHDRVEEMRIDSEQVQVEEMRIDSEQVQEGGVNSGDVHESHTASAA